jgi:hypothetical protein
MWEFAPAWKQVKMTRWQVRRYIKEMEEKRTKAQLDLEKARIAWELWDEDLTELDQKIDW